MILGYGKTFKLDGGQKIGIVAYIKHKQNTLIEDFETQAIPDVANNPFPFSERRLLVKAQSVNTRFINNADLGGFFNSTIAYNKSKISFKNIVIANFKYNINIDYPTTKNENCKYSPYRNKKKFFIFLIHIRWCCCNYR